MTVDEAMTRKYWGYEEIAAVKGCSVKWARDDVSKRFGFPQALSNRGYNKTCPRDAVLAFFSSPSAPKSRRKKREAVEE